MKIDNSVFCTWCSDDNSSVVCYRKFEIRRRRNRSFAYMFFVAVSIVGFAVLRILAYFSHKRKEKVWGNAAMKTTGEVINVFTANGNMQANMIINTLKENGIMAYGQDLGDAGFAAVRYGMGRGIDDRVAIMVASDRVDQAKLIIKEIGIFDYKA